MKMRLPILQVNLDTRKLTTFALVAFIVGGALGGVLFNLGGVYVPSSDLDQIFGNMRRFTSYDELKEYLTDFGSGGIVKVMGRGFSIPIVISGMGTFGDGEYGVELSPSLGESGTSIDFSGTNIQVEGVDEADVVKTDGEYIYYAKGRQVIILKAYPAEDAGIVTKINMKDYVSDIYISSDRLVIFTSAEYYYYYMRGDSEQDGPQTTLTVYDITDRANPEKTRELGMDGDYFNSRLIGDYLYYIITNPAHIIEDEILLPGIRENATWSTIEPEQIWCPNNTRGYMQYYTIASLDIQDPEAQLTTETFLLDSGSTIYVSPTNLYLTSQGWSTETTITKIGITDGAITFKANGTVPGYILNQFSMDEHNGYFRVATTDQNWRNGNSGNNVYVLDEDMETVGRLENLAPGEEIYSARFIGERCYLVTFKKVDPLFTIDLSDPKNPTVLGKLKIPGYSDYLHPYDENTLIGIGKETVEAEEGNFAWYQGVKISLFDVSDVANPREIAKIEIGDRGTDSPALYDHHAFLFSRARNLLVIPVLEAQIDEDDFAGPVPANYYGEYSYQGAYVFHISLEGIELRGMITHLDGDNQDLLKSGYWFDSVYEVERSLYIEENLYTLSQGMIKINNLETLNELAAIDLGE
jgi:inhibitor of cysteine peptidase